MVKMIGIAAVVISSGAAGFLKAAQLKSRECALGEVLKMLSQIQTLIRYQATDTKSLITGLSESEQFERLCFLQEACAFINRGFSAREALISAIDNQKKPFFPADIEVLRSFAMTLGTRDIDGELENISLCKVIVEQNYEQARQNAKEKGKLFCTLGVLCGMFVAILTL